MSYRGFTYGGVVMAFPDVPITVANGSIIQARIFLSCQNQVAINVFHWEFAGDPGTGPWHLSEIGDALVPDWALDYKAALSAEAFFAGIGLQVIQPTPTIEVVDQAGAGIGDVAGSLAPKQACGFIKKLSLQPGRHKNGRIYVAFPSASSFDTAGQTTGPYDSSLLNLADDLCTTQSRTVGGAGFTCKPVIYHRAAPWTVWQVFGAQVSRRVATQRRRGDYGRPNALPF